MKRMTTHFSIGRSNGYPCTAYFRKRQNIRAIDGNDKGYAMKTERLVTAAVADRLHGTLVNHPAGTIRATTHTRTKEGLR